MWTTRGVRGNGIPPGPAATAFVSFMQFKTSFLLGHKPLLHCLAITERLECLPRDPAPSFPTIDVNRRQVLARATTSGYRNWLIPNANILHDDDRI